MRTLVVACLVAALSFGASAPVQAAAPYGSGPCAQLKTQPAYTYTYQGAQVRVPAGRVLLAELKADGMAWAWVCRRLRSEYLTHR